MSDIDRIRQANDILDVVSEHVTLKRAGSWHKGLCPFHNEKTPSFHVHPERQIFKCFGCGAGGDVFKFVQLRENVDFGQAVRLLADRGGVELSNRRRRDSGGGRDEASDRATLFRANEWAAGWFSAQLEHPQVGLAAREYIRSRNIERENSRRFRLGFAPEVFERLAHDAGRAGFSPKTLIAAGLARAGDRGQPYGVFRNRLVFAIRDSSGRTVGFGGRALDDSPAKYLNTPETALFDKGRQVFGLDLARAAIRQKKRAVVVEGYMDCLMAHQFGFDETVAVLGTSFTEQQIRLLSRHTGEVILVFDSDEAGQQAADRAMEAALAQRLTVRLACVPAGKDPCDFLLSAGAEGFEALLNSAREALEFRWHQVTRQTNASRGTPDSQRSIEEFLRLVARSVASVNLDDVHQGFIATEVERVLGLSIADRVYAYINKLRKRERRRPGAGEQIQVETQGGSGNAEEAAFRQVLEVLLNAPEHAEWVRERGLMEQSQLPRLSRIAAEFWAACPDGGAFDLAGFLSRFEEPGMSALITDLQTAGERRGNYEATLRGALDCLEAEQKSRRFDWTATDDPAQRRKDLLKVSEGMNSRHIFHRKRDKLSWVRPPGPAPTQGKETPASAVGSSASG